MKQTGKKSQKLTAFTLAAFVFAARIDDRVYLPPSQPESVSVACSSALHWFCIPSFQKPRPQQKPEETGTHKNSTQAMVKAAAGAMTV